MVRLYGTEKQVKFANDIRIVAIDALEKHKAIHQELEVYIDKAIKDLSCIGDSAYIINQLKEICYTRKHNERMAILIEYMAYSGAPAYYKLIDNIDSDVINTLKKFNVDYDVLKKLRYIH